MEIYLYSCLVCRFMLVSQLDSDKLLALGQEEIEGLVKSLEQYSKEIPEDMLQVCLRST